MEKITNAGCLLLVILLFASCKEADLPPVIEGNPFFNISAIADGNPSHLAAGLEDYYLYTSYSQDAQRVYRLQGELRPRDCRDCGPQLRIVFRDIVQRSGNDKPDPQDFVKPGMYAFFGKTADTVAFQTQFRAEVEQAANYSFQWDLGDGNSQNQQAFTHIYNTFPATYQVSLRIEGNNCSSEISQQVDIPKAACFPVFNSTAMGNETQINFSTLPQSGINYVWDFGDGIRANGAVASHDFGARGAYTVCLQSWGDACQTSHCRNVVVGAVDGCAVNFSYQSRPVLVTDSLGLGEVEVYWMDENGREYSSVAASQLPSGFFELLSAEAYDNNEKGESTLAYTFSLSCQLSWQGEEMELAIARGRMALAYPK